MLRTPFAALPANGSALPPRLGSVMRGTIRAVNFIPGSSNNVPDMTFTVAPTSGAFGIQYQVVLLQPLFGNLTTPGQSPTGLVVVPEVGASVACIWDGSKWAIFGFYTGPLATQEETNKDAELLQGSYNPGIEFAQSRRDAAPGWNIPTMFGISPGDIVLGKRDARFKVNGMGALVAANANCLRMYKVDGEILEYAERLQSRLVGFWMRHRPYYGQAFAQAAHTADSQLAGPAMDAFVTRTEVTDVSPYPLALAPYHLKQRGFVSRSTLNAGRSATETVPLANTVAGEQRTHDHVVMRDAIIQPTTQGQEAVGRELDAAHFETFDQQVDADGSFRIRAGNRSRRPGGQTNTPTGEMDFSLEYDAVAGKYTLRVGSSGTDAAKVSISGKTATDSIVEVQAAKVTINAQDGMDVTSKTEIKINAPKVKIVGKVEIEGELEVTGKITSKVDVVRTVLPGIETSLILHKHESASPGSPTSPPIV